ncbi:MAG: sugar transferase [Solirubrobacterales bacterium]|nr:sugar transferase [Solirubrobacterales bacterium]
MRIDEQTSTQAKPDEVRKPPRAHERSRPVGVTANGVTVPITLPQPHRDIRSQRAPLVARALRASTLRAAIRIITLLVCDYAGIALALIGWLSFKAWWKGDFNTDLIRGQVDEYLTFAFFVTALLFTRHDLYKERVRRPGMAVTVNGLFQATVICLIFALASGAKFHSYSVFIGALGCSILTVAGFRALHDRLTARVTSAAGITRRALVVGTGDHAKAVSATVADAVRWPVEIVGGVTAPEDLQAALNLGGIDEVIIADSEFPQEQIVQLAERCHRRGIDVHVAPTAMEILLQRGEFRPGMAVPLFTLNPPVFAGIDFAIKRAFDLALSSALLVVLSPVLLASAIAIKLTSRGPLIYRSMRPGIGEVAFPCLKFRTMRTDADERMADLERFNEASGALFKIRQDPRVTRVGKLLRRFSIDELPQLWNVLRGEMSLVGPRPLPQRDFELLDDWHRQRYLVLPGITGLWQVSGRSNLEFDDLVRLDFVYLERWSVSLDMVILLKTFPAVLARRGAY